MLTDVDFKINAEKLTIYIYGEIDHHSAIKIRDSIDAQILNLMPKTAVMNFENVSFMDSSGIGLILARYKFCQNTGTRLYVEGVNRQTQKILALAGIKTINDVAI